NLYVADASNAAIRRIALATGEVTTVAEGIGNVIDVASDGAGNLYAPDIAGSRILRIVIATGEITTFAGSTFGVAGPTDGVGTDALFNSPNGITADGMGNLYVSDGANSTVRKIVIATAEVTTLAGTPGRFGGDDGIGAAARF